MFALLLAITLSVPSFAFAADEASESNAYSAAPARAERLIAKGKVIDPNGQPVAGVAVIIDETKTGTVTDGNGYYVIDVPNVGVHLTFTCLGYKPQTAVVPKSLSLDIYMEEDTLEMDAAVVVGMGHQRKASVIGAISSVSRDALKIPQRNLTNALAGKIAGAVVVQRTGEPGLDNAEFWIRGISSLNSSAPLVLVDGVERSMSDLSIEEIETISVLKDASATAVYGVRAANGVVLVTTRKGIAQKATIDVKIESGISNLVNMPKLLDGANYMRLYNEAYGSEFYSPEQIRMTETHADPYLYPNVNWFDELFTKFSTNSQVSVNVRGGGERARYYVTASYLRDNGNLYNNPDTDYNTNINITRYNFRSNIDMSLTKTTTLSLEIGANMTDAHQPRPITSSNNFQSQASELFSACYQQDPITTPVRVPLGYNEFGEMQWGWGAPLSTSVGNPAERLFGSGYNKTYRTSVMSQIILKQNLDFLTKGLDFTASFSYDVNTVSIQSRGKYSSLYAVNGVDDETGLYSLVPKREGDEFLGYSYSNTGDRADEFKAQFNYERVFNERHRVGAMAMYYQRSFNNLAAGSSILALPYRKQGLAFRATYSYDDRYFIEYNMGYNGSENFKSGERFGVFPAGAIGYLISNEPFWKVKWINHLKIRGSIGLVGSDVLAAGRFAYLSTWESGLGGHYFGPNATWSAGIGEAQEGVLGLTWEKGLKKDLGLELKMFDSMVSIDLDYFHEKRWDILIQRSSVPGIAGLNQQPLANMGRMTNHGFEATAEFNHHIGKVNYRIYGNFSFARNKITEKDEAPTDPWRMRTGHPLNQQFGLIALGLFEDQDEIDLSPEQKFGTVRPGDVKYLDYNGDGVVDAHDEVAIGYSRVPEINYGFGLQINWKGLDFGAFFRGQAHVSYSLGGSFFPFANGVGKGNLFAKAMDRWSEENPNPNAFYPRLSASASANNQKASTRTIYDGSLLRLSDLEVGYTFRGKHLKSWGCQSLRVYFVGSNLLLFSPWDMWDPESGSTNGSNYPLARKFNLGVRISF
ncbi:MAG: TonB-dependent receptor [Alistipes senegalensis]|uniref:SusC/RagA family TonB-linked outer membrane protein n=2 Tax=Alistipes TaxID=239759 RepID=UPI0030782201|nr:TonB-dependent receptor [Alistipes senegalensis]MBS5475589.1 TonB-dependent receptor [Alistipes sp.]